MIEMAVTEDFGNTPWHFMISRPTLSCSDWLEFVYIECHHDIIYYDAIKVKSQQ